MRFLGRWARAVQHRFYKKLQAIDLPHSTPEREALYQHIQALAEVLRLLEGNLAGDFDCPSQEQDYIRRLLTGGSELLNKAHAKAQRNKALMKSGTKPPEPPPFDAEKEIHFGED